TANEAAPGIARTGTVRCGRGAHGRWAVRGAAGGELGRTLGNHAVLLIPRGGEPAVDRFAVPPIACSRCVHVPLLLPWDHGPPPNGSQPRDNPDSAGWLCLVTRASSRFFGDWGCSCNQGNS